MTPVVIPPERLVGNRERILRILHPVIGHRFLPSTWIEHHLTPCEHANFVRTLRDLRRKPNQYIYWPEQQGYSLNAAYKDGVHALTDKGAKAVGIPLPKFNTHEYAHELGVSMVECSLKFGAREQALPFQMAEPQVFRFGDVEYVPDGHPMLIGDVFIPGLEFERRKYKENPGDTHDKIDKVIRFMKERIYEREGFAKALILFVATTERRTENLMSYVEEKLGACSFILFKTTPDWAREPKFPKPNGDMLTQPWLRVGCSPLNLAQAARKEGDDVQKKS
jgi:hypothetical protein